MSTWRLLARMPDLSIGGVLTGWSVKLALRYNQVGTWSLSIPPESVPDGWPAPGAGLILLRDDDVIASGMLDEETFEWSADPDDQAAGPGMYALTGDTDLGRLAYRIVYPTPGQSWDSQTNNHWVYPSTGTDVAEEVIRVTVNWQAGSLALADRQVPGLRLGAATGAGAQVRISERFTQLLEALRKVSTAGGGLAFDARDALDGNIDLTVRPTTDRTATCRFGRELGNVDTLQVRRIAPTVTDAMVAGQGEGATRELYEVHDPGADAAWGRREELLDQRSVDSDLTQTERQAEYDKAGEEAFGADGEQTAVSAVIRDTPTVQWGRDYQLGDRVMVLTPFGPLSDLVRQVDIEVTDTGVETITSVVGTPDPSTSDPLESTVRRLLRRVSQLERGL